MKRYAKVVLAVLLLLTLATIAYGSTWSLTLGGALNEVARDIQQTADGGYIVAGSTNSFGLGVQDAWLVKLDASGSVTWQKTYGSNGTDIFNSVQQTADGGYIVAGTTNIGGGAGADAWVMKLYADGSIKWQKTYGGTGVDDAMSIQQTADGGYIFAGYTDSLGAGTYDFWVVKLNAEGVFTWQRTYGGANWDRAASIRQTADGGYIVAGSTEPVAGHIDAWVLKLDANGNVGQSYPGTWQKRYPHWSSYASYANAIEQTTDGGYILAGYSSNGEDSPWVVKLNSDGSLAWQHTYQATLDSGLGTIFSKSASVQQTVDGGYIVAGFAEFSGFAWVLKLNADGSFAWKKTFSAAGENFLQAIRQTADGGYVAAGLTISSDAWVLKLDQYGGMTGCSTNAVPAFSLLELLPSQGTQPPVDTSFPMTIGSISTSDTAVNGTSSTASPTLSCLNNASLQWQKTYGGSGNDTARAVQQTADGGYIVAGSSDSFGTGTTDSWVMKLNADGSINWHNAFGDALSTFYSTAVQQTTDGGYIVAGYATDFFWHLPQAWVMKLNASGVVTWKKTYNSWAIYINSIQQTGDGGYIAVGGISLVYPGGAGAWIAKLSSNGSVDWEYLYNGLDYAGSVQQTPDGGFIVAGATNQSGAGSNDAWVMKLDAAGTVSWKKTYGGAGTDYANAVEHTADGGYIVVGSTDSFGAGGDAWVLKLNANGDVGPAYPGTWQKTYGGAGSDAANAVQQTADGGYIVAGTTASFGTGGNAWVFKLNADGLVEWQKTYGGTGSDSASSIHQTVDGGYILAGSTNSFGTAGGDAWVLKLDQLGNIPGCSSIGSSAAVPQNSTAAIGVPTAAPAASGAKISTVTPTQSTSPLTPGSVCTPSSSPLYSLNLGIGGSGTGRVTSSPTGIDCGADCSWFFGLGASVTLTAIPDHLAGFSWAGACSPAGQVTLNADKACYVTFTTPADFSGTPRYGYVPLAVNFTDTSTHNPTSRAWDFGDGGTATAGNPLHIYRQPGLYTVSLTATGTGGAAKASKIDYVTVAACSGKPVRIAGPLYRDTIALAYSDSGNTGSIDLQAIEFIEDLTFSSGKTVTLTGGYPCDYGARIGDTEIKGQLIISGGDSISINGITIR